MKRMLVQLGQLVLMAFVALAMVGCGGGGGSDGIAGSPGASGGVVTVSGGGTAVTSLSSNDFSTLNLVAGSGTSAVDGVTINSPPIITFWVKDASGNGITGLENNYCVSPTSTGSVKQYKNVAATIGKLIPGTSGSPDYWVSYIVTTLSANDNSVTALTRPTTDNTGTLAAVSGSPGKYTYTFARDIRALATSAVYTGDANKADVGDISFDSTKTHRVVVQISGAARGTGTNTANCVQTADAINLKTPVDIVYDFTVNADGTSTAVAQAPRDIVNVKACMSCHNKFTFHGGNAVTGFGGSRQETKMCVLCHTDQRKYGRNNSTIVAGVMVPNGTDTSTYRLNGRSMLDMPFFIHSLHMGDRHVIDNVRPAVLANEIRYPQMVTNCNKCHTGSTTPTYVESTGVDTTGAAMSYNTNDGENWNTKPSRVACGGCHIGINFAAGTGTNVDGSTTGHTKGQFPASAVQANDSACVTCHSSAAIKTMHIPVSPPNTGNSLQGGTAGANVNAAWIAGDTANLPTGAIKVTYDVSKVYRNASKNPVIVFRMLQDGVRTDFNARPALGTAVSALKNSEMWANFMGSPSAYFVWGVPQDGITSPSDYNASASVYLRSAWNYVASTCGTGTLCAIGATTDTTNQNNVAATFSGPDSSGYYTVTLTGTIVPDGATMLTGGLGYSYALTSAPPLTQTNLAAYPVIAATATLTAAQQAVLNATPVGGLIVIAPDGQTVASAGCGAAQSTNSWPCSSANNSTLNATNKYGYTARRVIVADARCNNCHKELGVFNDASFHAGQRNDGTTCSWCHNPNRTSSGWYVDSTDFVHAIHGKAKRAADAPNSTYDVTLSGAFTWHAAAVAKTSNPVALDGKYYNTAGASFATSAAVTGTKAEVDTFAGVEYPGVLKNCEACHVPGSYNFNNATNYNQQQYKLYRAVGTGYWAASGVVTKGWTSNTGTTDCNKANTTAQTDLGVLSMSPYIKSLSALDNSTFFGTGFSYATNALAATVVCNNDAAASKVTLPAATAGAATATLTYPNDATSFSAYSKTLVNTPTATVCVACHLKTTTWSHIAANGGGIYKSRATVFGTTTAMPTAPVAAYTEQCMICHSSGAIADIKVMHAK